eukprot:68654-Chlamydomonas_euryale.AAC.2
MEATAFVLHMIIGMSAAVEVLRNLGGGAGAAASTCMCARHFASPPPDCCASAHLHCALARRLSDGVKEHENEVDVVRHVTDGLLWFKRINRQVAQTRAGVNTAVDGLGGACAHAGDRPCPHTCNPSHTNAHTPK